MYLESIAKRMVYDFLLYNTRINFVCINKQKQIENIFSRNYLRILFKKHEFNGI